MTGIRAFCFRYSFCFVRAYEKFGSHGSSLSCDESVLCGTWLPGVEYVASWLEDFAYTGFICFRCEEDVPKFLLIILEKFYFQCDGVV
jgi:hypothetical protein